MQWIVVVVAFQLLRTRFLLPFSYERSKKEVICLVAVFFHSPSNSERFEPLSFRLHKPFRLPVYKYLCTCFHANVLVADSKFIRFSIRRLMISVLPSVQRVHANRIPPCVCVCIYIRCVSVAIDCMSEIRCTVLYQKRTPSRSLLFR